MHRNSDKPAELQAHAYTQGADIHVAPGQEHLLPHEAWHVVQQAQGRVQPTMQMPEQSGNSALSEKGMVNINDDTSLEKKADVMGSKAANQQTNDTITIQQKPEDEADMYTQKAKSQENKSRVVANSVAQNKSDVKQDFGFVDNRHTTCIQKKFDNQGNNNNNVIQRIVGEEYLIQLAKYFGVESSGKAVASALGIKTGTLLAGLAVFSTIGVVFTIKKMINYFSAKDPVEEAVLDKNSKEVKNDINTAMNKLKNKILEEAEKNKEISKALKNSGRDWMIYAPWTSWWNGMGALLLKWNVKWKIEDTTGLLLDIGGTIRTVIREVESGKKIMNDYMQESRSKSKKINKESEWAKTLPKNTKTQSGVSATTGNLIKILEYMNVNNAEEIEAIMNGVILYWKNSKVKQALGQFHTAVEVWSVYNYYLKPYEKEKIE